MAITFHPNIRYLMTCRGLVGGLESSIGITIYSGAQPSAASITSSWASYNSTTAGHLVHFSSGAITQSGTIATLTTIPSPTLPTNSGEATWGIIWAINPTGEQLASSTLPSTSFIVAPVTGGGSTGIIRISNTSITTGTLVQLLDVSIFIGVS